jgi:serine protease
MSRTALLVLAVSTGFAGVIRVPSQQTTIQAALNVAVANDTILVAPGTYPERLT